MRLIRTPSPRAFHLTPPVSVASIVLTNPFSNVLIPIRRLKGGKKTLYEGGTRVVGLVSGYGIAHATSNLSGTGLGKSYQLVR